MKNKFREFSFGSLLLAMAIPSGPLLGQALPAPTVDRVGFPAGYRETFKKLLTVDRPDNGQIRVIWGNAVAAATNWWEPYPHGSVLLFESYTSKRDASGGITLDENGRAIPDVLGTIFVKRKEPGFGAAYQTIRNGEWEYTAYRADGSTQTAPAASGACAACHLQVGPPADWTFRRRSFAGAASGVAPQATMIQYAFVPGNLTVKKGALVTWYNNDEVEHQIFSPGTGFFSPVMGQGVSFAQKFDQAGEFDIRCSLHPGMRSKVTVTE